MTREILHRQTTPLITLVFNTWIDPPIGYDMGSIDSVHPYYKVRIMSISDPSGEFPPLEVPFAEPIQMSPIAPGVPICDFQMVGVTSGVSPADPTTPTPLLFYRSMLVAQGAPGLRRIRSRVFTPPQLDPPDANFVDEDNLVARDPAWFVVGNVKDSSGFLVTVVYKYVVINNPNVDPHGPRHLFLQQPWA